MSLKASIYIKQVVCTSAKKKKNIHERCKKLCNTRTMQFWWVAPAPAGHSTRSAAGITFYRWEPSGNGGGRRV